jgi:5-methylthioadenosine/S-adenosylhomocysteine deaminase
LAAGNELYGKTIIRHMYDLGLLSKRVSLAHSIWVTEEDIALLAESGVSVVHNPVSNLSLGSGIMPLKRLLDAGVNVCLGTDGISASGALNMFEAMKLALLIQRITGTDYRKWPTGAQVLRMATGNGARAVGLGETVGSLAPGKKADLIVLDLAAANYVPLYEVGDQIVLSETGSSVNTVVVNGRLLLEDGNILICNEKELLEEAREIALETKSVVVRSHDFSSQLKPYVEQVYRRCAAGARAIERLAIGAE